MMASPAQAQSGADAGTKPGYLPKSEIPGLVDKLIAAAWTDPRQAELFRTYPDLERKLRSEIRKIAETTPVTQIAAAMDEEGRRLIAKYRPPYVRRISDDWINRLKANRLYKLLFEIHPEAETELRAEFAKVITLPPSEALKIKLRAVTGKVTKKYANPYVLRASNPAVYRYLEYNLEVLQSLEKRPEACAAFYNGEREPTKIELEDGTFLRETDLVADLFESAINDPYLIPRPVNRKRFGFVLDRWFEALDIDRKILWPLTYEEVRDPVAYCRAATTFFTLLVGMSEPDAAYIYKSWGLPKE